MNDEVGLHGHQRSKADQEIKQERGIMLDNAWMADNNGQRYTTVIYITSFRAAYGYKPFELVMYNYTGCIVIAMYLVRTG